MTRTPLPAKGGIAWLLFLFCAVALGAGLGFDLLFEARAEFWIAAQSAGAAAIGAGAAVLMAAAAHLLRFALRSRAAPPEKARRS